MIRETSEIVAGATAALARASVEQASFLHDIVDHVPVALFAKSAEPKTAGQYTLWNKTAAALFGLTSAEVLGKTDHELWPKQQADGFRAEDAAAFALQRARVTLEETVVSKTLGPRTLRTTKVPMFAADGSQAYLLVVCEDITARREIEASLVHAKNAAEAATQAKSAFLAAMSHEIRTPMNGILGLIDLMAEATTLTERKQLLRTIRDSGQALLRIIDDVLTFSKAEASRLVLEEVDVDLEELLENVMSTLAPLASRGKSMLLLELSPSLPHRVKTDPVRLGQVLFNLVSNAIKFTPTSPGRQGTVTVSVRALSSPVNDLEAADVSLELVVGDNGIGMSDATIAELFQPFVQADVSTTRRFGGTGLGLSIVRGIVELAQGTVLATSEPGCGSTFTVTWRAKRGSTADLIASSPLRGLSAITYGHGQLQEVLRGYLEFAGCRVTRRDTLELPRATPCFDEQQLVHIVPSSLIAHLSPEQSHQLQQRCVLLIDEPGSPMTDGEAVKVTTQPLCRSLFLAGLAVAAGLASPATRNRFEVSSPPERPVPRSDQAEAAGQLVLVAEDNAINREVIERQLARLGYACVVVPDGQSALDAWQRRRFGLILTDCHMPFMDGFALARQIRAAEAQDVRRVPILAITANVMGGEAERCASAGMDGYLSKPMMLDALRIALEKWLPALPGSTRQTWDPHALAAYVGQDNALQTRFLRTFLDEARPGIEKIASSLLDSLPQARGEAHRLKPSAVVVGAEQLAQLLADIEQHVPEDQALLQRASSELRAAMERVEARIAGFLGAGDVSR